MRAATSGCDIAYEQPQATKVWRCPRWFCNHKYSKPVTCSYHLRDLINDKLTFDEFNRWELFGGQWRVVEISRDDIVVELCTCTGDPVERRRTDDPALIEHLCRDSAHSSRSRN